MIDGVLLVDKPKDWTSRDVVNFVSKKLGTKKIGHTGTLDPIATGVLVLTIGRATKLSERLVASKKEYIAKVKLGVETDTLDMTGNVLKEDEVCVSKEQIEEVLTTFIGTYLQEVPLYSAVKVNGKKLYEYARSGISIPLPKHEVTIYDIKLLEFQNDSFTFSCVVSKGTYIRSLIRDIAYKLNIVATMEELRRVKQGDFSISECYTIQDIEKNQYEILPILTLLKDVFQIEVHDELEFKIKNGSPILNSYHQKQVLFVASSFFALYKEKDGYLIPDIMFF